MRTLHSSAGRTPPTPQPTGARLRATLLSTALLDEFALGLLTISLPLFHTSLRLSDVQVGLLFTIGELSSLIFEPPLNLLSDRGSKQHFILGGILCLALGFALASLARGFGALAIVIALLYPATGTAVGLAQGALVDAAPHNAPRLLARWTVLSSIGDVLAPLAIAVASAAALGWMALCWVGACLWLGCAPFIAAERFVGNTSPRAAREQSAAEAPDEQRLPLRAALRAALRDRVLFRWLLVLLCATMMDEIFQVFAALYLKDDRGLPTGAIALALAAGMLGGMLSLVILERLLRRVRGAALLPWIAFVALVGVVLLLLAHSIWLAGGALMLIGIGTASWYPIAQAAAYAQVPTRTGLVRSISMLFAPVEIALPGLAGLIASHDSASAAVLLLGLAPVGVLLLAPRDKP